MCPCEIMHNQYPERSGYYEKTSLGTRTNPNPRHMPVIMKRGTPLKHWGSVHHTAYILQARVWKVKHKCTNFPCLC